MSDGIMFYGEEVVPLREVDEYHANMLRDPGIIWISTIMPKRQFYCYYGINGILKGLTTF